jgi:error-prone DNA polymerase
MAERGIEGDVADQIFDKLAAFANFGFPESHSVSFAYLVYSSSWIKLHYPAAFCAALINAQPMGFYSPHSLVQDARRHGVEVRTPDINASAASATLEWPTGFGADDVRSANETRGRSATRSAIDQPAVRLGLRSVRHVGDDLAERIEAEREAHGPYTAMEDLKRRVPLKLDVLEALATAGAFGSLTDADGVALDRRRALWGAGAVAQTGADRLAGVVTGVHAPTLPGMTDNEVSGADLWATGVAPDGHPTRFGRDELRRLGVVPARDLTARPDRSRVLVGGVVTHRQRPATAGGTTFLNLEDETGLINVVVSKGCWVRHRRLVQTAPALLVSGRLETAEGVVNVVAERISLLPLSATVASRDFR